MFLLLQDEPAALESQAIAHVMQSAGAPTLCVAPAPAPAAPPLGLTTEAVGVVKTAAEVPAYTVD